MPIDHITRAINLALQECTLFTDRFAGEAYAQVRAADCTEFYAINSRLFADWLQGRYCDTYGAALPKYALRNAMSNLEALADDDNKIPVFLRFGYWEGAIYWDLGDPQWRCIRITADGWTVVPHTDTPIRFRRTQNTAALPDPERGGTLDELRAMLNITDDNQWAIISAAITCPFLPQKRDWPLRIPALVLLGPPTPDKTTLSILLRQLLDPSTALVQRLPRTRRECVACARANAVLVFDSVRYLSPHQADLLSSLLEPYVLEYRVGRTYDSFFETRPIIISAPSYNVANLYASISKYSFRIVLKGIRCMICEQDLAVRFDKLRSRLVGAIADRVSAAFREWKRFEVRLTGELDCYYYKLLDAIHWSIAAERGMNEKAILLDALAMASPDNTIRSKR